jgi:hypothetical protein
MADGGTPPTPGPPVYQRFTVIRTLVAAIAVFVLSLLLLAASIATHDSVTFPVAGMLLAVLIFLGYRLQRRRMLARYAAGTSPATQQAAAPAPHTIVLNGVPVTTLNGGPIAPLSTGPAAPAAPTVRRGRPRRSARSRLTGAVLALAAVVVVVVLPVFRTLHASHDPGSVVAVGTAQTVTVRGDRDGAQYDDAAGSMRVTVTSISPASAAQLGRLYLTEDEKALSGYLVRFTATKTSGSFDADYPGLFSSALWTGTASRGTAETPLLIRSLPGCASTTDAGRAFARGRTIDGCQIVLTEDGASLASVSFAEADGTFTWKKDS